MSLLPEQYLESTVYLEKDTSFSWTWFLIWIKTWEINAEWNTLYHIFLVTNKHNIDNGETLHIYFNKLDWTWIGKEDIDIVSSKWIYHENISDVNAPWYVDVVMLQVSFGYLVQWWYQFSFIPEENIVIDHDFFENKIRVWHEIYLLWFPLSIKGLNHNYPIARQWIIARNDKELLGKKEFYLDVNNFPWNSWWPVILKPSIMALWEEAPIAESKLLGTIKTYSPYRKTYYDNSVDPPIATVMMSENSWLAQWIPSYILYEMWKKYIEEQTQNTLFAQQQ